MWQGIKAIVKTLWSARKKQAAPDDWESVVLSKPCYEFTPEEYKLFGVDTLRYINEHGKLPDCKPNTFAQSLNTKDWGVEN